MNCGANMEGRPNLPNDGTGSGTGHLIAVAEVLIELSAEIEGLGAQLCGDPALITGHLSSLQAIDLIAQKQRWLATLLLADCPITAVNSIAVDALRERLSPSSRPSN